MLSNWRNLAASGCLLVACGGPSSSPDSGTSILSDGAVSVTDGGDGGRPVPACEGLALTSDGLLDIDLGPVARVVVRLTVDGEALPADEPLGALVMVDASGPAARVELSAQSPRNELRVIPRRYRVLYEPATEQCAPEQRMPCNSGVVLSEIEVTGDGALDIDIETVRIRGRLEFGTGPVEVRGRLAFRRGNEVGFASFPATAQYEARLLAGTYDVVFVPAGCDPERSREPCLDGVLRSQVALTTSGALDLVESTVRLRGAVRARGEAVEDGLGFVAFARRGSEAEAARATRNGTYDIVLLRGTHSVEWRPAALGCAELTSRGGVCNAGSLTTNVDIANDGALDFELPVFVVQGRVTLDGGPVPSGAAPMVVFGGAVSAEVAVADQRYRIALWRGTYEVGTRSAATCSDRWPCDQAPVMSELSVTADGVADIDVPSVRIEGRLLVNGTPSTRAREGLSFERMGSEAEPVAVPMDAGMYRVRLTRGTYVVRYRRMDCTDGAIPCGAVVLATSVLTSSGVLDFDVPATRMVGAVTVGAAAVRRGALRWDAAGEGLEVALDESGRFGALVVSNDYDVAWRAAGCDRDGVAPCNDGSIRSVRLAGASAVVDLELPVVRIRGDVSVEGNPLLRWPDGRDAMRGALRFASTTGGSAIADVSASDPSYVVRLFPGRYAVAYTPTPEYCEQTDEPALCVEHFVAGCDAVD